MKNLLFLFALVPLLLTSCAAPTPTSTFYHQHKRKKGVKNFKIPGWAVWIGSGFANEIVQDDDIKAALRLAKKVKKVRLMATEEGNPIHPAEVAALTRKLRDHNYDDLLFVRDKKTTVNIMVKEKKEKIKNLLVLVHEEDEFVYLDIKSKIKMKDIVRLIETFKDDIGIGESEKDKQRKEEEEKAKRPQA